MQFTNEFHVPADLATTFAMLTNLEKVAPCFPGATLDNVDGEDHHGQVTVKVGPMQMAYKGTARVVETDEQAGRVRIEASGRETRGSGTARATVDATLRADDDGTVVDVVTDLTISGRPAQFGRTVLADVGTRIIDSFAERLRAELGGSDGDDAGDGGDAPVTADGAQGAQRSSTSGSAQHVGDATDNVLDLADMVGPEMKRKIAVIGAAVAALIALVWWLARR